MGYSSLQQSAIDEYCKSFTYPVFLNRHICEMDKHIVEFGHTGIVFDRAEPAETKLVPTTG